MKLNKRKAVSAVQTALADAWGWIKAKARALGRALSKDWGWVKGRGRALGRVLATGWTRLKAKAPALASGLRALPLGTKNAVLALLRYRHSARFWSVLVALPALPIGALLMVGPVNELATGKDLQTQHLLTYSWLAAGAFTFAAGVGILMRAPAFRVLLRSAFVFSLPLPVAFALKTFSFHKEARVAIGLAKQELETWVAGGVQLSGLFLGVSAFLAFLIWFPMLRSMPCPGGFLAGRAGPVVGMGLAGAFGSGLGYLVWVLGRWLGTTLDVAVLRTGIQDVKVDYFVAAGGVLGAGFAFLLLLRRWRKAAGRTPRSAPPAPTGFTTTATSTAAPTAATTRSAPAVAPPPRRQPPATVGAP
ncbi:MAG TPA: hypothetical protein VF384_16690 [Planctomycetota bacterium]